MASRQISGLTAETPVLTDVIAQQDSVGAAEAKKSTIAEVLALEVGNANIVTLGTVTTGNVDAVVSAASTTTAGKVELATDAEMTTGTDTSRAITPANAKVELDKKVAKAGSWELVIAVGDETTATTTGTAKVTFRMPRAITLTDVRASLTTAGTGTVTTVDINEGGTTILSTKLTIDATEKTSTTAATAAVISDASLADDAEMTIDVDGVGTSAAGLKVTLIGTPA